MFTTAHPQTLLQTHTDSVSVSPLEIFTRISRKIHHSWFFTFQFTRGVTEGPGRYWRHEVEVGNEHNVATEAFAL